jgi:hypothetical protein
VAAHQRRRNCYKDCWRCCGLEPRSDQSGCSLTEAGAATRTPRPRSGRGRREAPGEGAWIGTKLKNHRLSLEKSQCAVCGPLTRHASRGRPLPLRGRGVLSTRRTRRSYHTESTLASCPSCPCGETGYRKN